MHLAKIIYNNFLCTNNYLYISLLNQNTVQQGIEINILAVK